MCCGLPSDEQFDSQHYRAQRNSLLLALIWGALKASTMHISSGFGSTESSPDLDALRTLAAMPHESESSKSTHCESKRIVHFCDPNKHVTSWQCCVDGPSTGCTPRGYRCAERQCTFHVHHFRQGLKNFASLEHLPLRHSAL
jgi:hypothetical protein